MSENIVTCIEQSLEQNFNYLSIFLYKLHKKELENNEDLYKKIIANLTFEEKTTLKIQNNDDNKKIKVMLVCNWCTSSEICRLWKKMSQKNDNSWDSIQIISEEDNIPCDYWCIINRPISDDFQFDPKRTIVFQMEPNMNEQKERWGEKWINLDTKEFLFVGNHFKYYNNIEWHLSLTYEQLMKNIPEKKYDNILSTILSDKYFDPGHIKRIDFMKFLESKSDMNVDIYGSNKFLWKNYKGPLPDKEKDDSLLPYKYSFNVENNFIKNYFTEKLIDGILAETLTFYSGCINVRDYIDERAFVYLNLSNFEEDYKIIKQAMEEDWWSQRIEYIRAAKKKILSELQFFPRLEKIISENKEN